MVWGPVSFPDPIRMSCASHASPQRSLPQTAVRTLQRKWHRTAQLQIPQVTQGFESDCSNAFPLGFQLQPQPN